MSSESDVRNITVECSRFPGEGSSSQGKSGPKTRPKGVVDDQQVDIPVPSSIDKESKQGHRRIVEPCEWRSAAKYGG